MHVWMIERFDGDKWDALIPLRTRTLARQACRNLRHDHSLSYRIRKYIRENLHK